MGSRKRSARMRQVDEFMAQTGGMDDLFDRERERQDGLAERREEALEDRACRSKQRYASHAEAEETIRLCEEHGRRGLSCYRCPYCGGWHLTSHPRD